MKFILINIFLCTLLTKKSRKAKKQNPEEIQESPYYYDASKQIDINKLEGRVFVTNPSVLKNTVIVQKQDYVTKIPHISDPQGFSLGSTIEMPYYDPSVNPIGKPLPSLEQNKGVFSVPINVVRQNLSDEVNHKFLKQERENYNNFIMKQNKYQGKFYYDPSQEAVQAIKNPDPISERIKSLMLKDRNAPKTQEYDEFLVQQQEQQKKNQSILNPHGRDYIASKADQIVQRNNQMMQQQKQQ